MREGQRPWTRVCRTQWAYGRPIGKIQTGLDRKWQSENAERERDPPDGVMFHTAAFDDKGAHIFDVWESAEKFQRFTDERLMPGVQQLGIPGQPNVEIREAHAIFAPAYE